MDEGQHSWRIWEYQHDGQWTLFSPEDCQLIDQCVIGHLGELIVSLFEGDSYLLDVNHLTINHLRSLYVIIMMMMMKFLNIELNGRECSSIRLSPTYCSLSEMGTPTYMIYKSMIMHGTDLEKTLRSLAECSSATSSRSMEISSSSLLSSSSSSSSSLPSSSLSSLEDQNDLPSLTSMNALSGETESDEGFLTPQKHFFCSEISFWTFHQRYLQSSWSTAFKRVFLLTRIPRMV